MDAGINNVIYMELHLGPKMVNGTCGKTIIAGTIDQGSTVVYLSNRNHWYAADHAYNVVCIHMRRNY